MPAIEQPSPRQLLAAVRTSALWCRLAVVAPFVVLGAIALSACGDDTEPATTAAADQASADASTDDATEGDATEGDGAGGDDATEGDDSAGDDATDGDDAAADDGTEGDGPSAGDDAELFPDVLDATASLDGDGSWTVSATLSSPYDTPERYADAWRVVGADGTVYGIRELAHDHAAEQPFTRSQSGIEIPDDVDTVTIEGRDQVSGWGGATFELVLTR